MIAAMATLSAWGLGAAGAEAKPATLRAGVGQADITPPLGYSLGGWQRADQRGTGVSTRLYSRALVLQRGPQKVALVSVSLWAISAGMEQDIARSLSDLGFTDQTLVLSANHTHQGPAGFSNNPGLNAESPSINTVNNPSTFVNFVANPSPADPALYAFLVKQIAQSVRRANEDRAPAVAGWGRSELLGVTQNRSLEAFLANFDIQRDYGKGKVEEAPGGYRSTVDPDIDVLRVDKLVKTRVKCRAGTCLRTRRRPIGAWSAFANHGTVVQGASKLYSEDHFAAANRIFQSAVRKAARVPASQPVVNVFANGAEGDISSGLTKSGVQAAEAVGRAEADKLLEAWNRAGARMSKTLDLGVRSTVSCFCGRQTATGPVASTGVQGLPFLTGSEEGRGPLYDITQVPFEGMRNPVNDPQQGDKIQVPLEGEFSPAVPVTVLRVGDRVIGTLPVEANHLVGENIEDALLKATQSTGVTRAVVAGLTDDWVGYSTTPKEYQWQAYEAGRTAWGPNEGTFLQERLVELAQSLAAGKDAPKPYVYDPSYGVHATNAQFPEGAAQGAFTQQPTVNGKSVQLAWTGAPNGYDRPVDAAFISVQRNEGKRWRTVDNDLGLNIIWHGSDNGAYDAAWQVPSSTADGQYRAVITADHYRLESSPFTLG